MERFKIPIAPRIFYIDPQNLKTIGETLDQSG